MCKIIFLGKIGGFLLFRSLVKIVGLSVLMVGNQYDVVQEIFNSSCTNCHSTNNPSAGLSLSNYYETMISETVIPGDSDGSDLFERIENGNMPPGPNDLSNNEIDLIKQWIDNGSYISSYVEYEYQVQPVLNDRCISCHSTSNPLGGLSLANYSDVVAGTENGLIVDPCSSDSSDLYNRISTGNMPPGPNDLTQAQINLIMNWIDEGAIEQQSDGSECADDCISGDINYDGILNILDVVSLVNTILSGSAQPIGECDDPNQDGILNVLDVVSLVNTILNI